VTSLSSNDAIRHCGHQSSELEVQPARSFLQLFHFHRPLPSAFNIISPLQWFFKTVSVKTQTPVKVLNNNLLRLFGLTRSIMPPSAQPAQGGNINTNTNSAVTKNGIETTTSTTTIQTTNGAHNGDSRKINILKDAVVRVETAYHSELGASSTEFLSSCSTIDQFFDYVAKIRLLQIPHHHSRWDKVLDWAEFFAAHVFKYSEVVGEFATYSDRAASIIWASCRSLLEVSLFAILILG
jgi:hypothetical protein